ncbi:hypothetical protein [Streptomyces fuscichromogenes]|uniref:Uncharacterized protein n=1 Tax=Streptomyces fuscichromogenes TaxID=1324013 RepID=A0A917XFY1_9ACTN|nr:hypothetical protein [Streptomyces fuscichromogenes]GGN19986.1 hypothetical protein GCM10011578_050180 [Streptomyces fuscichromogenes]
MDDLAPPALTERRGEPLLVVSYRLHPLGPSTESQHAIEAVGVGHAIDPVLRHAV